MTTARKQNKNIHKALTLKAQKEGITWKLIQKTEDNTEASYV